MPGQNNKTPRVEQISYLLWSNNAKKFPKYIQKLVNKKGFDEKRPDASEIEFQRYSDIVLYTKLSEIRKEMPVADNDIICLKQLFHRFLIYCRYLAVSWPFVKNFY